VIGESETFGQRCQIERPEIRMWPRSFEGDKAFQHEEKECRL